MQVVLLSAHVYLNEYWGMIRYTWIQIFSLNMPIILQPIKITQYPVNFTIYHTIILVLVSLSVLTTHTPQWSELQVVYQFPKTLYFTHCYWCPNLSSTVNTLLKSPLMSQLNCICEPTCSNPLHNICLLLCLFHAYTTVKKIANCCWLSSTLQWMNLLSTDKTWITI